MSDTGRNRAEGWQHAKLSGHINEDLTWADVMENKEIQERILRVAHAEGEKISRILVGGLNEQEVPSVLGDYTKSKTDLTIILESGRKIGVSIKCQREEIFEKMHRI